MEQRPQLHYIILQRRAGEQQTVRRFELVKRLPLLGSKILNVVGLVEDQKAPVEPSERVAVAHKHIVARDAHVEGTLLRPPFAELYALLAAANVCDNLEAGRPPHKLRLPVEDDCCGDNDQVWAPVLLVLGKVAEERNGLHRLAEAHFVREDAVEVVAVQIDHPLESGALVLAQRPRPAEAVEEPQRFRLVEEVLAGGEGLFKVWQRLSFPFSSYCRSIVRLGIVGICC